MDADNTKKITILSSFYNVEEFIPDCIKMLKLQTERNFNVILVDDGSTDNGYQKCIDAIDGDSRFSVIKHDQNKGLGSGRITGIENCKTEFLTYIDPDDYLAPDAVENYLKDIKRYESDYFVYDYYISDGGKTELITDNCNSINELFDTNSKLISHVWHKVVRTELYKQFDYSFLETVSFSEDLFNSINCFLYARNIAIIHKAYYTYKYNATSMVHSRSEKSIKENIAVNQNLLLAEKLKENIHIKNYIEKDSFYAFGQFIFPNLKNDFQKKCHFSEWKKNDKKYRLEIPKATSFFVKTYIFFIRYNFLPLAYIMFYILKIKEIRKNHE